jgi:hemoglobin-like flavoprotein
MVDYQELFKHSYFRALGTVKEGKGFFDTFYDKFISCSPEAKEKFKHTDLLVQKEVLEKSLAYMSRFAVVQRTDDYVQSLATKHSKRDKDVQAHLYDVWLTCLIDTVKEHDREFDDDVELAWRINLAAGITYMKFKYDK